MNFVIKMTEQEYWDRFLEKFKECLNSGIETYEEKFLTGKFWDVLWRLKDDTSALHKTHDTLAKMEDSFIRLDSYRPVLLIQIWSIKEIYESKLLERIFANFLYLVEINEESESILLGLKMDEVHDVISIDENEIDHSTIKAIRMIQKKPYEAKATIPNILFFCASNFPTITCIKYSSSNNIRITQVCNQHT